jgi:hypothetical protein
MVRECSGKKQGATMKEWQPVFLLARNSLIIFAVVLITVVALVMLTQQYANNLANVLAQTQAELQNNQTILQSKEADLENMESHIKRYETLKAQGLVGEPQRALWVENLRNTQLELQLPDTLGVELLVSQPLMMQDSAVTEAEEEAVQPLMHDLVVNFNDVHELEVLNLIAHYKNRVKGRFRLNECKFSNAKETGMDTRCVLRFVTVPAQEAPMLATTVLTQ